MARKYRSRLAKKESQRIMKQSLLLFVITGFFVVAIVIWGIPAIIRMASFLGELGSSNDPITSGDTIPPYTPQLSIPYEATSSSKIDIKGYGEADSTVKLFNGAEEITSVQVSDSSEFTFESIQLSPGSNEFSVISVDTSRNESTPSEVITVLFDNQAPIITLDKPADGDSFYTEVERMVTFSGTVDEDSQIYVAERITFANSDGEFNQKVRLEPGENTIEVRAVDLAGNVTTETVTLNYSN